MVLFVYSWPVTSVGVYRDMIVAGYATGHLRVFHMSGSIIFEATAHARAISAIDVSPRGMVSLSLHYFHIYLTLDVILMIVLGRFN